MVGALGELVKDGYIGSIGLTQVSSENLIRAAMVHPIKMIEYQYSICRQVLICRDRYEQLYKNF